MLAFPGLVPDGAFATPGHSASTILGHGHEEPLPLGCFGGDLESIGALGRSGDLLRSDDPLSVGSVVASYSSCSPDLLAPFGAPPSYADVFDPSFALAQPALSLASTSTPTLFGVFYPSQFYPPSLPTAAPVQLPAVPVRTLSLGLHPAIDTGLDHQQASINPPLDDWDIGFNFTWLPSPSDATFDGDQPACGPDFQGHSPASDPSSPTSGTTLTSQSAYPTTSSLASSNYGSPAATDPINPKPRMGDAFSCRQCRKNYGSRAKLKLHGRYHGNKEYGCSIAGCDERFSTKPDLKRHQESIAHGGKKLFQCLRCPEKAYTLKYNLQRHERKIHNVDLLAGRGYRTLGS